MQDRHSQFSFSFIYQLTSNQQEKIRLVEQVFNVDCAKLPILSMIGGVLGSLFQKAYLHSQLQREITLLLVFWLMSHYWPFRKNKVAVINRNIFILKSSRCAMLSKGKKITDKLKSSTVFGDLFTKNCDVGSVRKAFQNSIDTQILIFSLYSQHLGFNLPTTAY